MTHKILIADDEPNIVISLEYLMKREGYDVSVARDGPAALAAIRRDRPALVLLAIGQSPAQVLALLLQGSFGSAAGLSYTLYYATTFVFTGLSVAIAYHAGGPAVLTVNSTGGSLQELAPS